MNTLYNYSILFLLSNVLVATTGFTVAPRLQTTRLSCSQPSAFWAKNKQISNDDEMFKLSDDEMAMEGHKLGINFGSQLDPMNEEEKLTLSEEVKRIIDEKVTRGVQDLEKLREKWRRENEERNDSLERSMTMNGKRESDKLHIKVDAMVGKFLSDTSESRERTHHMAWVAEEMAKEQEREKERQEKKKHEIHSWSDTNNEWDSWDDWNTCG